MRKKPYAVHDHGLWDEVARSIRPLGKRAAKAAAGPVAAHSKPGMAMPAPALRRPPPASAPPPLTGFDRRTEQRFMRGKVEIDARLDLHGMGLEIARDRLLHFLSAQRQYGHKVVLVITGKGASPFASHTLHGRDHFYAPERDGKLRRNLPDWLHEAAFRSHVSGFQPAHPKHGGGGAFYVKLRRLGGRAE
jgi:DNA-nicking Smr family endonuclease